MDTRASDFLDNVPKFVLESCSVCSRPHVAEYVKEILKEAVQRGVRLSTDVLLREVKSKEDYPFGLATFKKHLASCMHEEWMRVRSTGGRRNV